MAIDWVTSSFLCIQVQPVMCDECAMPWTDFREFYCFSACKLTSHKDNHGGRLGYKFIPTSSNAACGVQCLRLVSENYTIFQPAS